MSDRVSIGVIGYGEVGKIFARGLREAGAAWVGTWDRLLADPVAAPTMRAHAIDAGVDPTSGVAALLARADLVICAVTASQTLAVATEAATHIRPGTWFVDLNSASPGTKRSCAAAIDGAGGRYVESAVMTAVPPHGVEVPMLLGGRHVHAALPLLAAFGFSASVASEELGVASAIKMCRSVFIKGFEAIVIESFTTARTYGVEAAVLASLAETFPEIDWAKQGAYFFSRVAQHGKRRAEEMREAAVTVREAGLEPHMASATAERQDAIAHLREPAGLARFDKGADWRDYADALIEAMRRGAK